MTRITPITDQEGLTDAQASVFAALVQSRGSVRGPFGVLLHRPEIAAPVQELGGYLQFGATLPTPVRESVILTTARIWDCDHEWDTHLPIALVAVSSRSPLRTSTLAFDEIEGDLGIATRLAAALINEGRVADALFEPARRVWASDELVELVAVVGYYSLLAMVINAFEIPSAARGQGRP